MIAMVVALLDSSLENEEIPNPLFGFISRACSMTIFFNLINILIAILKTFRLYYVCVAIYFP